MEICLAEQSATSGNAAPECACSKCEALPRRQYRMTGSGKWIAIPEESVRLSAFSEEGPKLLAQAKLRLGEGSGTFTPHTVDDASFLSEVVYSLEWNYAAVITGMFCDQWAAITAETHDHSFGVWAECDNLEHGLAAVWLAFADRATAATSNVPQDVAPKDTDFAPEKAAGGGGGS